ncbi:mitochondrial ATP synthase epsilon chain-domain-containing protein [Baffinella frigidus]|nr:mitochondrial ATP synthase epsilon chain-domain-containing protein [Cryptophyta sp. CCMP2293]
MPDRRDRRSSSYFDVEWRQAGISYLRYANICAQVVRRSLKEPMKTKALLRDNTNMRVSSYEGGKKTTTRLSGTAAEAK